MATRRLEEVERDLREALEPGAWNALWNAQRVLGRLPPRVSLALVRKAMTFAFPFNPSSVCRRLPDDYVRLALGVLDGLDTAEAIFLRDFQGAGTPGEVLRAAAGWLRELQFVHHDKPRDGRPRLARLVAAPGVVAASQAAVAVRGSGAGRHLAVLAFDGSAESADVLLPIVESAVESRDPRLDELTRWLEPYAQGPYLEQVRARLGSTLEQRGASSELHALKERLGGPPGGAVNVSLALESSGRRSSAWVALQSHALPTFEVFVTASRGATFSWADGVTSPKSTLALQAPGGVDGLPAFLARVEERLCKRWVRSRARLTSTLRGKARQHLLDWLLPPR